MNDSLKEVKNGPPTLFLSSDEDTGKILAMASVPKAVIAIGLAADAWVKSLADVLNGKGGGKAENAQLSGTNVHALTEALVLAEKYAQEKLKCDAVKLTIPIVAATPATETKTSSRDSKKTTQKASSESKSKKPSGKSDGSTKLLLHGSSCCRSTAAILSAKYSGKALSYGDSAAKTALETSQGRLEGSMAAALYLAPDDMKGNDHIQRAQVDRNRVL